MVLLLVRLMMLLVVEIIYTEASAPRDQGDVATIYSKFYRFKFIKLPELNFYYHMFGPNMGTLDIEIFNGSSYINIFSLSGDQGDQWFQTSIPISTTSNIIQFKISGKEVLKLVWRYSN